MNLDASLDLKKIVVSENVAGLLSEEDRSKIAHEVIETYQMDLGSRAEWEERMKTALNLALQVAETKTFPWPNAANDLVCVVYPIRSDLTPSTLIVLSERCRPL